MSEIKFTDDELKSIQELSQKSNEITNRFGQLAIAKTVDVDSLSSTSYLHCELHHEDSTAMTSTSPSTTAFRA